GRLVVRADAFPSARCCKFYGFLTWPCLFPPGAMPRVQHLEFWVSYWSIAIGEVDCGMNHLPSLEHVKVTLQRDRFTVNGVDEEVDIAKALLRRATEAHPKRPTIEIYST
uniref:Disease resistance R13L4/SHOC-2-like LRR domain-containing protein n=3 Tax=Aegilops tauschii subsp. strangulata TaxID=200361 RepID=A0A453QQM3_AEGTS